MRDLHTLSTNFVNFKDLYDGDQPAVFQCGTLYLDQRSCTLCITVEDPGEHATMAGLAGAYLAYVDCVRSRLGRADQCRCHSRSGGHQPAGGEIVF